MGNAYIELALDTMPVVDDGYNIGFTAAHIALMSEQTSDPFKKLGIMNCGIGGHACSCNIQRVPGGVDIYKLVNGIDSARNDIKNKVVL